MQKKPLKSTSKERRIISPCFLFFGVSVCVGCVARLMDVRATPAGAIDLLLRQRNTASPSPSRVFQRRTWLLTPPTFPFRRRDSTPFLDGIKRVPCDSQPAVAGHITYRLQPVRPLPRHLNLPHDYFLSSLLFRPVACVDQWIILASFDRIPLDTPACTAPSLVCFFVCLLHHFISGCLVPNRIRFDDQVACFDTFFFKL